jgi:hypothetical protein
MIHGSQQHPDALLSTAQLLKATGLALVVAGVILVTAVLPAEYGIDPTGIGKSLGLTALHASSTEPVINETAAIEMDTDLSLSSVTPLTAVWKSATPYRSDVQTLTLQPDEGAEIKAKMKTGERFVFKWQTDGGTVNVDMHGEKLHAKSDEYSSYWKERNKTAAHGEFQAPFEGTHGWYWRNRGDKPVTITVNISGYYEKLYRP